MRLGGLEDNTSKAIVFIIPVCLLQCLGFRDWVHIASSCAVHYQSRALHSCHTPPLLHHNLIFVLFVIDLSFSCVSLCVIHCECGCLAWFVTFFFFLHELWLTLAESLVWSIQQQQLSLFPNTALLRLIHLCVPCGWWIWIWINSLLLWSEVYDLSFSLFKCKAYWWRKTPRLIKKSPQCTQKEFPHTHRLPSFSYGVFLRILYSV